MHGYARIFLFAVHVSVYMHAGVCQQENEPRACSRSTVCATTCARGAAQV